MVNKQTVKYINQQLVINNNVINVINVVNVINNILCQIRQVIILGIS